MAFKAVVTSLVKLNAVIDSESFSAYLKPHAVINYRNLQAADLKLDAFSLNRFFETVFGFDDQALIDILKPLDDSVSLASDPANHFYSSKYSPPVFLEDTVALQVIFDRQFESEQFLESHSTIDSGKELTTNYSFTSLPSLHPKKVTESSYSFLDSEIRHIDLTAGYNPLLLEKLSKDELADLAIFCTRAAVDDYLIESVGAVGSVLQIWANVQTRYWLFDNEVPDLWDAATVLYWVEENLPPDDAQYVVNRYYNEHQTNWYPSYVRTNLVIDTHRGKFGGAADTLLPILDKSELLLEKPTSSLAKPLDVVSLEQQKPFTSGYGVSDDFEKSVQYSRSLASAFTLDDLLTAGVTDLEKYTEADKGNIFGFESKTAFDTAYKFDSAITLRSDPAVTTPRDMSSTSSLESTPAQHFYKEINPLPGVINLASLDLYQLSDAVFLSFPVHVSSLGGRHLAFDFNGDGQISSGFDTLYAVNWVEDNLTPYEKEQYDEINWILEAQAAADGNPLTNRFWATDLITQYRFGKKDGDPIWFVDNFDRTVSYSRSFESDCDFIDSDEKAIGKVVESPAVLDSTTAFDIAAPLSSSPFSLTSVQAKSISLAPADDAPFANPTYVPNGYSTAPFFGWGLRTNEEWADILFFIKINNLRITINNIPSGVPAEYATVGMWEEGEQSYYALLDSYVGSSWVLAFMKLLNKKHGADYWEDVFGDVRDLVGEGPLSGPLHSFGYHTTFLSDLFAGYYNTDQIGIESEIEISTLTFPAGNSSPNNSAFNATSFN